MLATLALTFSLAALAATAGLFVLLRRAGRARAELAERQHRAALALDRRCDAIQAQLDALTLSRRIDHLTDLVSISERQGRLPAAAARRLERYVLDLQDQAQRRAEVG